MTMKLVNNPATNLEVLTLRAQHGRYAAGRGGAKLPPFTPEEVKTIMFNLGTFQPDEEVRRLFYGIFLSL
jgi:hypothetical protein